MIFTVCILILKQKYKFYYVKLLFQIGLTQKGLGKILIKTFYFFLIEMAFLFQRRKPEYLIRTRKDVMICLKIFGADISFCSVKDIVWWLIYYLCIITTDKP